MASNPVFNQFDKQLDQNGYARFGQAPQQGYGRAGQQPSAQRPPAGGMTMGQAGTDAMSAQQMEDLYRQPPAGSVQMGRLTIDDVVMKTLGLFALLVGVAAATWFTVDISPELGMPLWIGGMLASLAVGLVIAFKKTISVPLIVAYAGLEGVFVGAVSQFFERAWPGIVMTAVIATLSVFAGMFAGWKFGIIKVTERSRRIFGLALVGYLIFALVNFGAAMFGVGDGWGFGGTGLVGIGISVLAVGLASYSLAIDFDTIDRAVAAQVPQQYSWLLAHGLIVSVVWLYLELLRLLARLREE